MVGKVFTEHRATFAQLDMKKTLKVVGRFIHNDAVGMKRIFAKAEAKKEAGEAVARAIQSLTAMAVFPSPSLHFFRSIIAEVRVPPAELANRRKDTQLIMDVHNHVDPEKAFTVWNSKASPEIDEVGADTQARLGDPLFRVALLDAAWKESAGKGKLGILLKNREGGARDGTRALKSDLRKLAETGSWDKLQKAASLAHALDKVKTAQGSEADKKQWLIAIARGVHHEFGIALPEQLDSAAVSDWIGKALTALLHPEFQSAEVHSAEGSDNRQIGLSRCIEIVREFF